MGEDAQQTRQAQATSEYLAEDPVEMSFNSQIWQTFNHILEVEGNMESEQASCCSKVVCASHGGKALIPRWIPEVKGATNIKKET